MSTWYLVPYLWRKGEICELAREVGPGKEPDRLLTVSKILDVDGLARMVPAWALKINDTFQSFYMKILLGGGGVKKCFHTMLCPSACNSSTEHICWPLKITVFFHSSAAFCHIPTPRADGAGANSTSSSSFHVIRYRAVGSWRGCTCPPAIDKGHFQPHDWFSGGGGVDNRPALL